MAAFLRSHLFTTSSDPPPPVHLLLYLSPFQRGRTHQTGSLPLRTMDSRRRGDVVAAVAASAVIAVVSEGTSVAASAVVVEVTEVAEDSVAVTVAVLAEGPVNGEAETVSTVVAAVAVVEVSHVICVCHMCKQVLSQIAGHFQEARGGANPA